MRWFIIAHLVSYKMYWSLWSKKPSRVSKLYIYSYYGNKNFNHQHHDGIWFAKICCVAKQTTVTLFSAYRKSTWWEKRCYYISIRLGTALHIMEIDNLCDSNSIKTWDSTTSWHKIADITTQCIFLISISSL